MDEQAPPRSPAYPLQVQKPARFEIPEGLPLTYSDVALVQETTHAVRILFFQAMLPVVRSPEAAEAIESVRTVCVAQIVVPFSVMDRLVEIWQARKPTETTK